MSCAFFLSYRSECRAACHAADEGLEIGLETADVFLYISCQYFKAWALLHLGKWGEALVLAHDGIQLSQKNGHGTAETVLRMIEARLHLWAYDFAGARRIAEQTLPSARAGFPNFVASIAAGEAYLGLGQYDREHGYFQEVQRKSQEGPFRLDWIFQLPLRRGLWLARADLRRARNEAERLCELAEMPGERTHLALGRELLARIAEAQGLEDEAEIQMERALAGLENFEAPLAEWRVLASAAEFYDRRGLGAKAAQYRNRSAAAVGRIASSMDAQDDLRKWLLAAPAVESLLLRSQSAS